MVEEPTGEPKGPEGGGEGEKPSAEEQSNSNDGLIINDCSRDDCGTTARLPIVNWHPLFLFPPPIPSSGSRSTTTGGAGGAAARW